MKKIFAILLLTLLIGGNASAKIDHSYLREIREGCINEAKRNNDDDTAARKFCRCYANQFDKKFNNKQLLKFLNKSQQEQAKIVNNEISPPCYPKSKKKNKKSISILPSKLPVLECTFEVNSSNGTKEITETIDLAQLNKKMIKQGYGKLKITKDHYNFEYIQKNDGAERFVKGYVNRATGSFLFTSSEVWEPFFDEGDGKMTIGGVVTYRKDVLDSVAFTHTGTCDKAERKNL